MRVAHLFQLIIPKFIPFKVDTIVFDSNPWLILHWERLVQYFRPDKILYRQSDSLAKAGNSIILATMEQGLLSKADVTLFVNRAQADDAREYVRKFSIIANGLKFDEHVKCEKKNIVFHYGKFPLDYEELKESALSNPTLDFVIAGEFTFQSKLPNLRFLGHVNSETIEGYVSLSRYFYLPYAKTPATSQLGITNKVLHALSASCQLVLGKNVNESLFYDLPYTLDFSPELVSDKYWNSVKHQYSWGKLFEIWQNEIN